MATRYWVGGTGTWNASSTANWSASSGGASGASAPVAADTVIFDSNSGTGTCTTASGAVCSAVTFNTATVTLVLGANLTMGGNFTLTAGTVDLNSYVLQCFTFLSTTANTRALAFGASGKIQITRATAATYVFDLYTATSPITVTGTPLVELLGNFPVGATQGVRGTLDTNNPISVKITTGSGTFNFGSGFYFKNIDFTGFSGTWAIYGMRVYGDLTLSSTMTTSFQNTPITFLTDGLTQTITSNGVTINSGVTITSVTSGTNIVQCADALTLGATRTLTLTAGELRLRSGATTTVGTFATSGTIQKILDSTSAGVQATLSQASGVVNANNTTIQDINATGGATWNAFYADGNIDAGNNTGWEFGGTPAVTTELTYRLRSFTTPRRF